MINDNSLIRVIVIYSFRLRGTELGAEEHYIQIYKCISLDSCTFYAESETKNMEGQEPFRCWSKILPLEPGSDECKVNTHLNYV
jgi:hypothetical protein